MLRRRPNMGFIGGTVGYRLLKMIGREGGACLAEGGAYANRSKLEALLGPDVWRRIDDRVVIDFGCGEGAEAVEMATRGARRVIGVDVQAQHLRAGRERAERAGCADRCTFAERPTELADVIVAVDSFEHFADPPAILETMARLLKPEGCVLVAFGPPWYHPLGGHLFSVFPWAHLIFTEAALIRWRSDFKSDGATRFEEVAGGLNRMTVGRFVRIVERSPLEIAEFEARPIRRLELVANRFTREVTTAVVRCTLRARHGNAHR